MINKEHITPEILQKLEEVGPFYLNEYQVKGITYLVEIMNRLPGRATLTSSNLVNVIRRENLDLPMLKGVPRSYIEYTLNDFVVYVQFGDLWAFEGVMVHACKITNNRYSQTKYLDYIPVTGEESFEALLHLLLDPQKLYNKLESIKGEAPMASHDIKPSFYVR